MLTLFVPKRPKKRGQFITSFPLTIGTLGTMVSGPINELWEYPPLIGKSQKRFCSVPLSRYVLSLPPGRVHPFTALSPLHCVVSSFNLANFSFAIDCSFLLSSMVKELETTLLVALYCFFN